MVKEITGRKKTKEGQVTSTTPEERLTTWKVLLGDPPVVEDPDEDIPTIFDQLEINDDMITVHMWKHLEKSNLH